MVVHTDRETPVVGVSPLMVTVVLSKSTASPVGAEILVDSSVTCAAEALLSLAHVHARVYFKSEKVRKITNLV